MAKTSKSGPENLHTLVSVLQCILCFQRITFLRTYLSDMHAGLIYSDTRVCKVFLPQTRHLFCYKSPRYAYR